MTALSLKWSIFKRSKAIKFYRISINFEGLDIDFWCSPSFCCPDSRRKEHDAPSHIAMTAPTSLSSTSAFQKDRTGFLVAKARCLLVCDCAYRFTLKPLGCKVVLVEPSGFKTPLTSTENFQAACDRAWNQCPPATQEEYTTQYMYRCKQLLHV